MVPYEIGQVHVSLGIQQDVIRLDVAVHNALPVDVAQSTAELRDPEADGVLGEGLARDVEAQIAAIH